MTYASRAGVLLTTALVAFAALAGCGRSQPSSEQNASAPRATTISVAASTAGTISGVVSFTGMPPKVKPLDMTADPGCPTGPQPADVVLVKDGKLANVFIYVKEGLPQGKFAVSGEQVVLDQKGCRYNPHMIGIM